ncbi:MAG: 23S rRNA (pseudouridine(1915)-N(3))-methyltransferase RlmH [Alphaproteobacteria bacterium]
MKITIAAIGKLSNKTPEATLINEYVKRIPWKIEVKEFEEKSRLSPENLKVKEGEMLLSSCENHHIILLDERGTQLTSHKFADLLAQYQVNNINRIGFLIGGAFGHGKLVEEKANFKFSLSSLTFPHMLARALLIEQIYRAYTINTGHPYHK